MEGRQAGRNMQGKTVDEIIKELEDGLQDIFESKRYSDYLLAMSKFHDYSFRNTILIILQNQDASMVAGYSSWKKNFGRHVKKGEKAIRILAPMPFKQSVQIKKVNPNTGAPVLDENGQPIMENQSITKLSFRPVSVFDVSQTEGKDIPLLKAELLTGEVQDFKMVQHVLHGLAPCPVSYEHIEGSTNGYYLPSENRIAVQKGLSQLQTAKTLIHEITHAYLHGEDGDKGTSRGAGEIQAESTAFVVCSRYGLDTSDYSFPYIAGWSKEKDTKELLANMEIIQQTASAFIMSLDRRLEEVREQGRTFDIETVKGRVAILESIVTPAIQKETQAARTTHKIVQNEVSSLALTVPEGSLKKDLDALAQISDSKQFAAILQKVNIGLQKGCYLSIKDKINRAKQLAQRQPAGAER